jgi:hypothetical protein
VGVDPQTLSETDCNRVLSGVSADVGVGKCELVARLFEGTRITFAPFRGLFPGEYLADPTRVVPEQLRASEAALRFEWVLSCVDRDRHRIGIARTLPRHVFGGSTHGLLAQATYYSGQGPCECLACHRKTPEQLGIERFVQELQRHDRSGRERWYDEHGATLAERASIEEYLSDPSCARPGEADLARLGVNGPADFAVGFVSVAAGVMLAARFLSSAIGGVPTQLIEGSELRYFGWKDELAASHARRASDCVVCADSQNLWRQLWSA